MFFDKNNTAAVLEQMILRGHLDMAFTSTLPTSPELAAEFCAPLQLVAFAAKGYRIAPSRKLTLADLERIPLIIRDDGNHHGTTELPC